MTHFNVSNVNISTLNITANIYSLGDAMGPVSDAVLSADGYRVPYLFNTGCDVIDGVQNCTVACQDPRSAFSARETLHNCVMYPVIADQYSKGNLSKETAQLADSLGIGKEQWSSSSSISLNIIKTIYICLNATICDMHYCEYSDDQVMVSEYSLFLNQTSPYYLDLDFYEDFSIEPCDALHVTINQDIGGIGVRHSEH